MTYIIQMSINVIRFQQLPFFQTLYLFIYLRTVYIMSEKIQADEI